MSGLLPPYATGIYLSPCAPAALTYLMQIDGTVSWLPLLAGSRSPAVAQAQLPIKGAVP